MSQSLGPTTVVRACLRQMSANLEGETVVLNFEDGMYYSLDPVGARIWELIQHPCSVADVQTALLDEFDVEAERCGADLLRLLDELRTLKMIEIQDAVDP